MAQTNAKIMRKAHCKEVLCSLLGDMHRFGWEKMKKEARPKGSGIGQNAGPSYLGRGKTDARPHLNKMTNVPDGTVEEKQKGMPSDAR